MPVYLLQEDDAPHPAGAELKAALRSAIPELREAASLDAVAKSARGPDDPTIAIALLAAGAPVDFDGLVDFAARLPGGVFLIVVGGEISATQYKRLVRGGAGDWVPMPADVGEVLDIIARRRSRGSASAARTSGRNPATISFIPSAGGVGNTTLAVEVAAYIKTDKAARSRSVCLVDLDFQTSHVCDYLDSEPRLQIGELCSAPERLDDQLFESFKTHHSSGIDIFAAPRSKFSSEKIDIHALDALLTMIAARFDLILIIFPLHWFAWMPQIIAASDGAIVAGTNTIPGLRQVSETIALVRSSGSAELAIRVALNRCERTVLGSIARRKHAEMVLRDEQVLFIGQRPEAVESVNIGVPMLLGAGARRARREFAAVAGFCASLRPTRVL
jgi:pilus assembly protein CpaE